MKYLIITIAIIELIIGSIILKLGTEAIEKYYGRQTEILEVR